MKLEVFLGEQCWCLRHVDDLALLELFGTDTLPLPFTPQAMLEQVLQDVRSRHPEDEVVFVEC